jgi:hypothetical protein
MSVTEQCKVKARPFLLLVSGVFLERHGGREKNKNKTLFPHFSKVSSSEWRMKKN